MQTFVGARVFDGERLLNDMALVVEGETIRALVPFAERPLGETVDLAGGVLAPGLVDWQVNGGGGHLFNDSPTPETIRAIVVAHRRYGSTAICPTIITDAPAVLREALAAAVVACTGSLGAHVEGPFIDPLRHGAHPIEHIRHMAPEDAKALIAAKARVVTLAPASATREQVAELARAGIVVSLGHAEATAEEAYAYFDAGVRAVTHLFNAMSPLQSREPGLVGAALADIRVFAGFIADGLHVHPVSGRLAYRLKGAGRLALVSDAMPPAAGGPDVYALNGRRVTRDGARLTLEDGTLAGAVITLLDAVRFVVRTLRAPMSEALRMATSTPARLLGIEESHGVLKPGARADLIALDDDLNLRGVWVGGEAQEFVEG